MAHRIGPPTITVTIHHPLGTGGRYGWKCPHCGHATQGAYFIREHAAHYGNLHLRNNHRP